MASFVMQAVLEPDSVPIGNCTWIKTFDNDQRNYLHQGLVITGVLSQILTLWLNFSIMLTTLWNDNDYSNFAIFTVATCLRKVASGIVSLPSFRYIDRWFKSNLLSCVIFAYQDCFFSLLELEGLTHVCIARFVMARYAAYRWSMNRLFTYLYIASTVLFSAVYTYIPMFGYGGSFYYDFSCTTCTFDMLLPDNSQRYIIVLLFFMRSIKPALVMMASLTRAYYLDKNVCTDREAGKRMTFTRNLMAVTAVILLCWLPLAVIRGYVIIGQLLYDKTYVINSMIGLGASIKWAMLLYWISPAFMVITLMLVDKNIRYNMINLVPAAKMAAELAEKEEMEKRGKKKE